MRQIPPALSAAVLVAGLVLALTVFLRPDQPHLPGSVESVEGGLVTAAPAVNTERAPARAATLRRITSSRTYVGPMLADQDSVLRRWPDRMTRPLRVHLPAGEGVSGWREEMGSAVQAAFFRWERVADVPIRFEFVRDTLGAEVRVRWIREFQGQRTGQADIVWNPRGWIVRGTLTLAVYGPGNGPRLTDDAVHTVALHEIGHLLGLGHSDDPGDVMYPTTEIRDLTLRDQGSARLLYGLEPGSLR